MRKQKKLKYDVLVIGAGPVGIYTAIRLAKKGHSVLVVEEDEQIGKPRFCTGLISKDTFDRFFLPKNAIENQFNSAVIFSPLDSKLCLKNSDLTVYVVDRTAFDQSLYKEAKRLGVKFILKCRCLSCKPFEDFVEARLSFDGIMADARSHVAVLATGIKYNLHRALGISPPESFLDCSQVQMPGKSSSTIEIFLGNNIAPHSFAWVVPVRADELRIGLSTFRNSSRLFLKSFIKKLKNLGYINKENCQPVRRLIPLGAIKKSYSERILIVGDAAGQVKPTTGGGIHFGFLCSDIAADTIIEAFMKKNFSESLLKKYEINWKKKIDFDLTMGMYFRKLIGNLNDQQIDRLIKFCSQEPIQRLIEKRTDFNSHGSFIKELIKKPIFWKTLYQTLTL